MNILIPLILSLIAGLSTLIGALFIFIPIKENKINKFVTFSLSFSIIIMIGISLFDLLPEAILYIENEYNIPVFLVIIPLFILSYFIIKIIYKSLKKYESNLYKLGILSMITLILHNMPEGVLTFLSTYINSTLGIKLTFAIALHNIPEGIAIAVPIYYATGSKKKALSKTLLSGLSEPFGALIAYLFLAKFVTTDIIAIILVLVAGLMITLAIEGMLPEALKYKETKFVTLGFIFGIIIIIISKLI